MRGKKMEKHISWVETDEKELEEKILAEYSDAEVRKHLEYLTTLCRMAGTGDELKAAKYIKGKLDEYGIDSEIHEFEAYISYPGKAELEILSPVKKTLSCLPRTFIAPTPADGIEAELISLGEGLEENYQGVNVRGKVVLIQPLTIEGRVQKPRIAEEHGAAAQIHITEGKSREISMGQVRYTWGNPTPETKDKVPAIPIIAICNEDGKYLTELHKKSQVLVRLKADCWRGYKKIRLPIGILKGVKEPEKYVLFGCHYCSWFGGATDNASSNSLMLEMARIFSKYKDNLGRGIRFAWWSGHEQGTYAGSTWYLDNFWEDIRDNAVAYFVMDGLGRIGSSGYKPSNTEEIRKFHELIVKEVLGLKVKSKRVVKTSDQSFWGMGLPSTSGRPYFPGEQAPDKGGQPRVSYSHSAEDTLDKVDMALISIPFKVNAVSILRLCNNPILPFEFVSVAAAFKKGLNDLIKKSQSVLDLTVLKTHVEEIEKKAVALNNGIEKILLTLERKKRDVGLEMKFNEINTCLMDLGRIMIPAFSSKTGRYGQDPMGTKFKPFPTLQVLGKLNSMDMDNEGYKALQTSLLRERNKLADTLNMANRILDSILEKIN